MDIEKVLRTMAELLDGESVIFDEDSWSYGTELTIYGSKRYVRSARICEEPLALVLETEDAESEGFVWEKLWIPAFRLELLDEEEVFWLLHAIFYDIPYDCDITEWEAKFNELMED